VTVTADRLIYTDSAYDHKKSRKRFRSKLKLKSKECKLKSRRFKPENENNDKKKSNFRKRITDGFFKLLNITDDQLTEDHIGRFKTENFLKRILRKNISERCGRLLRTIREGKSLLKKNRKSQRKLSLRKDVQEDSLSLRENITKKVLLDNTNDQQNLILDKEEDIRRNLKEDIKEIPLSLQKNIQRKANKSQSPVLVTDIQESSQLKLKKDIENSPLLVKKDIQKGIQKEELAKEVDLLVITHDQRNITLVKRDNHNNSLLKEEGTNKNVKSFLLPKKDAEEYLLTKTNLEKQLTLKDVGKDLSSKNIQKNIANENSQLKTESVGDTNLFLKKYVQESPSLTRSSTENSSHLINKNVDDNLLLIKKNISTISPLMQLTKKDIQENVLKLSKSIFEENLFLECKDSKTISQLIVKSFLLSQKKDIPNSQLQLIEKIIQDDFLLTKNLISLAEKEKDISVISQSQLIGRDIPENFLLAKDLYSPSRKIIFSTKQDISLSEEDISEENVLSQLTKNIVQSSSCLSKKSYFLSEKDISSTEKKEELLQPTRKTILNNLLLKKDLYLTVENQIASISSLRLKQVRSNSNLFYRSSIVYRCCPLKNIQQVFQGSKKNVRKGSNSICKVKQSPSPEENWSGQKSTGSDIIGSADKYDSVAKCKLMVSNRYAKHQSIAKPLEEHIKIFKISSCPEQLINISEEVFLADSIAGSIESVSVHSNFEKDFKKNPQNLVTKEKNFDGNLKYRIINVQESEKTLKEPINKIKYFEEILTNQVTKGNINNFFENVKIIDKLEAPYQRLIQGNSQNSFDLTNHQFNNPINPQLSLIYSKEDSEKKNTFNKIKNSITKIKDPKNILKNSFVKIHTNNSYTSKIIDNLEVLNNLRLIQKSLVLIDYQSGNSQLPLIERKLLESEKRHKIISKRHYKNPKMRLNVRLIRIRDKLVLCLSALAILFTLLLVMDLQMDLGYSGHHLNPSHARIRIGDPPDIDTVYNNFRRKFLQRGNSSRELANSDVTPIIEKSRKNKVTPLSSTMRKHDDYTDLVNLVVNGYAVNVDEGVARISGEDQEYNPTIGELRKMTLK